MSARQLGVIALIAGVMAAGVGVAGAAANTKRQARHCRLNAAPHRYRVLADRQVLIFGDLANDVFVCYRRTGRLIQLGYGQYLGAWALNGRFVAISVQVVTYNDGRPPGLRAYSLDPADPRNQYVAIYDARSGRLVGYDQTEATKVFAGATGALAWTYGTLQLRNALFLDDRNGPRLVAGGQAMFSHVRFTIDRLFWQEGSNSGSAAVRI